MLAYSGCRDLPPWMDPQKYTLRAAGRRCAATSAATGSGITASAGTPNAPSLRRMARAVVFADAQGPRARVPRAAGWPVVVIGERVLEADPATECRDAPAERLDVVDEEADFALEGSRHRDTRDW